MHIPRVLSPALIPADVVRQVSDSNPVTASPDNGTCAGENKPLCSTCNICNTILHVLSKTLEPR